MIKNITKLCIVFNIIFFLSFDILAKNKETYELLDLFGQIFDEVQKNYVEEVTDKEVEETTALYLNEKLMKVELDENFYAKDRYMLTYEEIN